MKRVFIFIGVPGIGKSTYLETTHPKYDFVVLSLDRFRREVLGNNYFQPAEPFAHSWIEVTGRYLLGSGVNILLDNTHVQRFLREKWVRLASEFRAHVTYVWFDGPVELAKERNRLRPEMWQVPETIIDRMSNDLTENPPSLEEGCHEIIRLIPDKLGGWKDAPR